MTTLAIEEETPEVWPAAPAGLSAKAAAIPPAVIWRRIESWVSWRWGERTATFTVEGGCGSWRAPLAPFSLSWTESWSGAAWAPATLPAHPLGGVVLNGSGHYRFVGTLGTDASPPEDVLEAYRRLAEYSAAGPDRYPGASRVAFGIGGGDLTLTLDRSATWVARAIHNSGAADLPRPYRRAP